jgi:ABC-type transporter Mla MlaB component
VGLFSRFKKNEPGNTESPATTRLRADSRLAGNSELDLDRHSAQLKQRELARATALKIDAIEAAMANDIFNTPEPAWGSMPAARPPAPPDETAAADAEQAQPATLALPDEPDTELLGEEELPAVAIAAQNAPVVEEIAVLYANGQVGVAEQMLTASLADAGVDRTVWWMLFDLYQVTGQQDAFDSLSIDYASKFETSPPSWTDMRPPPVTAYSGVTPTQSFAGILDETVAPQLQRLLALAMSNPVLRLEFHRVSAVTPAGCAQLLQVLRELQTEGHELIVVSAAELAQHVRAVIQIGRRGDTEPCWLLLLELLQLLNREKEFEETGMDYCVTFEVSPPSFAAPKNVATSAGQYASGAADRFMLPAVVDVVAGPLAEAITEYAEHYEVLVFDCSRLTRLDFSAASALQDQLAVLVGIGKKVEFRDVNHLVAALLRMLSYADIARIFPHNY